MFIEALIEITNYLTFSTNKEYNFDDSKFSLKTARGSTHRNKTYGYMMDIYNMMQFDHLTVIKT